MSTAVRIFTSLATAMELLSNSEQRKSSALDRISLCKTNVRLHASSSDPEGLEMAVVQQHATILVVDDEPAICLLVKTLLEREGYGVFIAGDAETATNVYEEHSAEVGLLLTDMKMPGMNGPELADRILLRKPEMRVIFMSGSHGSPRGFVSITKPFTQAELIRAVGLALDRLPPARVQVAAAGIGMQSMRRAS
jgi:CheY-like chemotaxis protein